MALRSFMWGIESWEAGYNEFLVRFTENRVRILSIKGTIAAAPQPNHQPFSQIIRQCLATLINVGARDEAGGIEIVSTPSSRANQSVSNHIFSLNIKQLNSEAHIIPVDFRFDDAPILLASNMLMMHLHNESYKMQDSAAIASKDQNDSINVEMHLKITYDTF